MSMTNYSTKSKRQPLPNFNLWKFESLRIFFNFDSNSIRCFLEIHSFFLKLTPFLFCFSGIYFIFFGFMMGYSAHPLQLSCSWRSIFFIELKGFFCLFSLIYFAFRIPIYVYQNREKYLILLNSLFVIL